MTRTSPRFRLIALVLALHLAHVPIPVCDGDDVSANLGANITTAARLRGAGPSLDVDLLLLGVDPPEDSDEGPFDGCPENHDTAVFVPCQAGPRAAAALSDGSQRVNGGPLGLETWHKLMPRPGLTSVRPFAPATFGASFSCAQCWRTLISVQVV